MRRVGNQLWGATSEAARRKAAAAAGVREEAARPVSHLTALREGSWSMPYMRGSEFQNLEVTRFYATQDKREDAVHPAAEPF